VWKGTLSTLELRPVGLFDPVSCKNKRWSIDKAAIIKGRIKWKAKNRVRVALLTENPPHSHWTISGPIYGMAEARLVITVAPQKDICPQGRT